MNEDMTNLEGGHTEDSLDAATSDVELVTSSDPIQARWLAQASAHGEADIYLAKRSATRFEWDMPLEIKHLSSSGQILVLHGEGLHISEHGIGFRSRTAIETYSSIEISVSGEPASAKAVVRHCTTSLPGFIIGAEFE